MKDNLKAFMPEKIGLMPAFRTFPFDAKLIMESARKNMHALAQAQQTALEAAQTLVQRQSQTLSQTIESQMGLARALFAEGTPEEKIINNADMLQRLYSCTVNNMRETRDMLTKSSNSSMNIVNNRVLEALDEVKASVKAPVKSNVTPLRKAA